VWLYAIIAATLLTGVLLYANIPGADIRRETDTVAVNEIVKQAALCWTEPEILGQTDFMYPFSVIDNDGRIRYASGGGMPENIPEAVKRAFLIMDITTGAGAVGKALIDVSPAETIKRSLDRLAAVSLISFALLCALNCAFLLALHGLLIKPFKRLEAFAHKISAGRFDEPLPMDRGNAFGLFTQSFDIMRESLFEARESQQKAERAKKELIASLSHDIKTPITSIRLISELLRAGMSDPAALDKLKTIENKADQIDRLMNDMLHSALEELGELKVAAATTDSNVLKGIFANADHLSKARIGGVPACLIEMDPARTEQVIGNIVTNSYKYSGTDIDVVFSVRDGLLQADINDYGAGVAPNDLDLITTKYYRGKNAVALNKAGEGLGLYIAGILMEKMGGGLECFNRPDGFTVRLLFKLSG